MRDENYGPALTVPPPLSGNTVTRRIELVSEGSNEQPLNRIKQSPKFPLQINKSTNVAGCKQLLVCQTLLSRKHLENFPVLSTQSTGSEMLKTVKKCTTSEDISWSNFVGK
jgi:hypothetical protein